MNHLASIRAELDPSMIEQIMALAPQIALRGDEIEAASSVPQDILADLEEAGAFRMCLPKRYGGGGVTLTEACAAIEAIASADASVAWHMMVAVGSQIITSKIPLASLEQYYAAGPDTWPKAAASPKGIAIPVEGGYRLSGRWALASGAREFDWVSVGFFVKDENGLRKGPDGVRPEPRVCLIPRAGFDVIATWDAAGLRGTRSDDLACKDVFVPEAWQAPFMKPSSFNDPIYTPTMPASNAPFFGAIVMGLLGAAVKDLAINSLTRKPAFNPVVLMKDEPVFLSKFGELVTRLDSLRALHHWTITALETWHQNTEDEKELLGWRIAAAETMIHQDGTSIMNEIILLGGSTAVYSNNIQQRRWRDLRCAAQHVAANIGNYGTYASSLVKAEARALN